MTDEERDGLAAKLEAVDVLAAELREVWFEGPFRKDDPNRLPPRERYERDPRFRMLVDMVGSFLYRAEFTPTELREAVILAATRHAERSWSPYGWKRSP